MQDANTSFVPILRFVGVLAAEITASAFFVAFLPLDHPRDLIAVGTFNQVVGVVLVAYPDLENTWKWAWEFSRRGMTEGIHKMGMALRKAVQESKSWVQRMVENIANWYRQRRGRPRIISASARLKATSSLSASLSASVIRPGTVEERLERLENEMARLPGQWRQDITNLRDSRITLRWYGVPLILLGMFCLGVASW